MNVATIKEELLTCDCKDNFYVGDLEPSPNHIFLFLSQADTGNNSLTGNYAVHKHGASYTTTQGPFNNSFGLELRDSEGGMTDIRAFKFNIKAFVAYTKAHADKIFFVPDFIDQVPKNLRPGICFAFSKAEATWLPFSFKALIEFYKNEVVD
jgi:hypothetical protein